MVGDYSRRRVLRGGLAATGLASMGASAVSSTTQSNTIRIESDGGGRAAYEFTVSGSLSQVDDDDQVSGNRAYGHVGPARGTDTFRYSGEITGFALAGPATVYRNGTEVRPTQYPVPSGLVTEDDFPSETDTKRLEIESDGGGTVAYEFTVSGSLRQVDDDDQVSGNRAYGHVGPARGTDTFEFTGDVTRFVVAGPASVFLDGEEITPSDDDTPTGDTQASLEPGMPPDDLVAPPETRVFFEATVSGPTDDTEVRWFVDELEKFGPGFHEEISTDTRTATSERFEETGTHTARVELYEGDPRDDGTLLDAHEWSIRVGSDGAQPPTVERVRPDHQIIEITPDSPEEREYVVNATDGDSELYRLVWWIDQCDQVVGTEWLSGSSATASIRHAADGRCPLTPFVIDETGLVSDRNAWIFRPVD